MVALPKISINTDTHRNLCFGCGQNNPAGLKLCFTKDGNILRTEFTPGKVYQGWPGIVHGGILAFLLDEAMNNAAYFEGNTCVTASMEIRLRQPVKVEVPLVITASVSRNRRKVIETEARVCLKDGTVIAESTGKQYVVSKESGTEAVLWDVDGVIADTGVYHFRAWQDVFRKKGAAFTEEDFKRQFGQRNDTIIKTILGDGLSPEEVDIIANEKEENYRRRVAGNIKPLPGALELIKSLRADGVKMAVASSGPVDNIKLILRGLDIEECFQAIVYGREVTEGKPSPQLFLLAASKLSTEPDNCVVIEDAVAGVAAAKKAGMKCVAVTNSHPGSSLKQANLVVDTLAAVSIGDLARLFHPKNKS